MRDEKKRGQMIHMIGLTIMMVAIVTIFSLTYWELGVLTALIFVIWIISYRRSYKRQEAHTQAYIQTLSYRVHRAGELALAKLPIGMVLYNEHGDIEWVNPFIHKYVAPDLVGQPLSVIEEKIPEWLQDGMSEAVVQLGAVYYEFVFERDARLIYIRDVTEKEKTAARYSNMRPVVAHIYLDNYDEVTQAMEDQIRSRLLAQVTEALNRWACDYDLFLRRTASDRFLAIMNQKTLRLLEENRFGLLDDIRELTAKEKVPITLSIGIGSEDASLRELGALAQSSLDLALGRGGDQVAIKKKNGRVRFYGGKTNAVEKRTRVRARVISHALTDFVKESRRVIIMGHKRPDMDAVGAAIGMLKMADLNDREGWIVLDQTDINVDVGRLLEEVHEHPQIGSQLITPQEAVQMADKDTLLVIVDTHKPALVIEPKLLSMIDRVVVLDHHRRSEEFVKDPVLVYVEPYASSTAELVTELLEYQPSPVKMDRLEATALLAGMMVDTNRFAVRTGARTFAAASFLRANGADTSLVQRLLKEDLATYTRRAKLVENAYIFRAGYAVAVAPNGDAYDQPVIAKAADTLLSISDVRASFVICGLADGQVGISARSLGDVNVQTVMERLGGGGHLSNAATQLQGVTLNEAQAQLEEAIDHEYGGGSLG
ncbi:DHH family phosphoesterase [Bacillus sp. FSL W7-1360]